MSCSRHNAVAPVRLEPTDTRSRVKHSTTTVNLNYSILKISNSYTMGCPPVRGDNPRALASGLSYVQRDKHGITILYHLHQCRPCTSQDISC